MLIHQLVYRVGYVCGVKGAPRLATTSGGKVRSNLSLRTLGCYFRAAETTWRAAREYGIVSGVTESLYIRPRINGFMRVYDNCILS